MDLPVILIQTVWFYLAPLLLGRAAVMVFKREQSGHNWLRLPFYFGLGTLILFGLAMFCRYGISLAAGWPFHIIYFPMVWSLEIAALIVNWQTRPRHIKLPGVELLLTVILVLTLSLVAYDIWMYKSPYPLNWDWYQHQTMSRLIQQGQFSFFTSDVSDTYGFNSYPPVFHILFAVAQYPARLTPPYVIRFWQLISFWHLVTVGIASWVTAWSLSKKKHIAWLAAIIGILIFDSSVSLTSFFILPQTVVAVLFATMFAKLLSAMDGEGTLSWWEIITALLVLPLMHYMVGGVAALIFAGFEVYRRLSGTYPAFAKQGPVLSLIVLALIGAILLSPQLDLNALNQGEAASYLFTLSEKVEILERSYGYLAYLLLPLGVIYALMNQSRRYGIGLVMVLGLTLAVLTNLPYVLKFFVLTRFWVGAFMAIGLWSLLEQVESKALFYSGYVALTTALVLALMANTAYWKVGLLYNGLYTHVANDDVAAAAELYSRFPDGRTMIISDPATQFILEGLAGADSVGGAYMKQGTRTVLLNALDRKSPADLVAAARTVRDGVPGKIDHRLLVISGRTFVWQTTEAKDRMSFNFDVWSPVDVSLQDFSLLNSIRQLPGVQLIYASPYISVFQVE